MLETDSRSCVVSHLDAEELGRKIDEIHLLDPRVSDRNCMDVFRVEDLNKLFAIVGGLLVDARDILVVLFNSPVNFADRKVIFVGFFDHVVT